MAKNNLAQQRMGGTAGAGGMSPLGSDDSVPPSMEANRPGLWNRMTSDHVRDRLMTVGAGLSGNETTLRALQMLRDRPRSDGFIQYNRNSLNRGLQDTDQKQNIGARLLNSLQNI